MCIRDSLDVDLRNSQLLVVGPEFLYNDIVNMVTSLDIPNPPSEMTTIPNIKNMDKVLMVLNEMYGPKLNIVGEEDENSGGGQSTTTSNSAGGGGGRAAASTKATTDAARAAIFNQLRQTQQRGGGNRGGGGGGGGNRRGGR